VANTIGKSVHAEYITLPVILAGLLAAIFWNLITWWYGIPSSSSHTLIGGFAGAAITHAVATKGFAPLGSIVEIKKITEIILFIFLAPIIGMVIAIFITVVTVMRNTWARLAIIAVTTVITWFLFAHFEQVKLRENMAKQYKLEKRKADADKSPEARSAYEAAQAAYNKTLPLLAGYKELGAEKLAAQIKRDADTGIDEQAVVKALRKADNWAS
jgi:phosphate/sulfate permease